MERYKISKLLNYSTLSKFVTKKWVEVNDLSSGQYSINKNIRFKTSMLISDLCDFSDAYIVVKGRTNVRATEYTDIGPHDSAFKNNAPFRSCITKINSALIDNAEDLDIDMSMYNLLEYSQNYSMTSESLWNYFRDEIDNIDDNASDDKSFKYKTKIIGKTEERPARPAQPSANPDGSQRLRPAQPPIPPLNTEVTIPKDLYNIYLLLYNTI